MRCTGGSQRSRSRCCSSTAALERRPLSARNRGQNARARTTSPHTHTHTDAYTKARTCILRRTNDNGFEAIRQPDTNGSEHTSTQGTTELLASERDRKVGKGLNVHNGVGDKKGKTTGVLEIISITFSGCALHAAHTTQAIVLICRVLR